MRMGSQLFGFTVPAFVTRKADTLVRLKDGQTLIIAGLILRNRNAVVSKVPYLGDHPIRGRDCSATPAGRIRKPTW